MGVADAFAFKRLNVPMQHGQTGRDDGVREVGWSQFGELARELAERIGREFSPQVILGVVNGGVFLGGALAVPLRAALSMESVTSPVVAGGTAPETPNSTARTPMKLRPGPVRNVRLFMRCLLYSTTTGNARGLHGAPALSWDFAE